MNVISADILLQIKAVVVMCGDFVHVFMDSFNTSFLHHYTLVIPLYLAPSCVLHVPHVNISQSYGIFMKQHLVIDRYMQILETALYIYMYMHITTIETVHMVHVVRLLVCSTDCLRSNSRLHLSQQGLLCLFIVTTL